MVRTGRYLLFRYNTYYPEGGMNDCVNKSDSWQELKAQAVDYRLEGYHTHIYDTYTGQFIETPDD